MAADFQQMSDYFRTRNVRIVNMSREDDPREFEAWLSNTGAGADPAERKRRAAEMLPSGAMASRAPSGALQTRCLCASQETAIMMPDSLRTYRLLSICQTSSGRGCERSGQGN
jgi:hypothetical protein